MIVVPPSVRDVMPANPLKMYDGRRAPENDTDTSSDSMLPNRRVSGVISGRSARIASVFSPLHPSNAPSPICVTLDPISKVSMPLLSLKAPSPMVLMES